ncbi:hypothetical protein GCM10010145_31030 [Streptomyces ruber]|uniref:Uncharacterized protein n=2 Tax=Streptomyces TaxID=1883 RepID=A0A918BDT2_9ACTN|nr:hypothetical protein GCM10010145_31030 [Streptomyces ruber]
MIAAMPRPAAETAEQTVSAIIRSSRRELVERVESSGSSGVEQASSRVGRFVRPFHRAPPHTRCAMVRPDLREISGFLRGRLRLWYQARSSLRRPGWAGRARTARLVP